MVQSGFHPDTPRALLYFQHEASLKEMNTLLAPTILKYKSKVIQAYDFHLQTLHRHNRNILKKQGVATGRLF